MRSRMLNGLQKKLQKKRIYMFANELVSQIFTRSNLQTFHNGIILIFFFYTKKTCRQIKQYPNSSIQYWNTQHLEPGYWSFCLDFTEITQNSLLVLTISTLRLSRRQLTLLAAFELRF